MSYTEDPFAELGLSASRGVKKPPREAVGTPPPTPTKKPASQKQPVRQQTGTSKTTTTQVTPAAVGVGRPNGGNKPVSQQAVVPGTQTTGASAVRPKLTESLIKQAVKAVEAVERLNSEKQPEARRSEGLFASPKGVFNTKDVFNGPEGVFNTKGVFNTQPLPMRQGMTPEQKRNKSIAEDATAAAESLNAQAENAGIEAANAGMNSAYEAEEQAYYASLTPTEVRRKQAMAKNNIRNVLASLTDPFSA